MFSANLVTGLAILNTHVCAVVSLLTWTMLNVFFFGKPSVISAVQLARDDDRGRCNHSCCGLVHCNHMTFFAWLLKVTFKSRTISNICDHANFFV